jgi:adenylosuccinate synthase
MPVTVIVGGQYGSEGKGKVAHWMARERLASVAVRTGGPNAGHTVEDVPDHPVVLRQLPTAAFLPEVMCVLGPGSYIDPELLLDEVAKTALSPDRLLIDPNATVITEADKARERDSTLRASIGSTQSGTGAAVLKRIERAASTELAKNDVRLRPFIAPVTPFLRSQLSSGKRIILEGTQGFGLSLLHSPTYPYVTSRDTTAAAFVSEVGLSPMDVDEVVMVLRAFPIRVSGNSGPLPNEIEWQVVTTESGRLTPIIEYTSVSKKVRRVARFDAGIVRAAIEINAPTHIALNHVDYIDDSCREIDSLSQKAHQFVDTVERLIGRPVDYLGFGPSSMIPRKQSSYVARALARA